MAAAAKEARASRRKEERQLKEYVHTLEVHLDQVRYCNCIRYNLVVAVVVVVVVL